MIPNIVLIGFMGCGKSSVGRRLAALTGYRFVDTDELIVQNEDCTISEIFSAAGEQVFRDIEQHVIGELVDSRNIVLATGGGAILREANRNAFRKIGVVVWLDADSESLFERATRSHRRPLLQTSEPRKTFDHLLALRRPIYEETADLRLDSTNLSHDDVAQRIFNEVKKHVARDHHNTK